MKGSTISETESDRQEPAHPQHTVRTILGSLREYKKASLLAPGFVSLKASWR